MGRHKNKGNLTVMIVYFLDGNARTFRSRSFYDRKGKQAGIDNLKRYAYQNESAIYYAIIYDTASNKEIERVIVGDERKLKIYLQNKKNLKP